MYMYTYICLCVCICVYINVYKYVYVYIYMPVCLYIVDRLAIPKETYSYLKEKIKIKETYTQDLLETKKTFFVEKSQIYWLFSKPHERPALCNWTSDMMTDDLCRMRCIHVRKENWKETYTYTQKDLQRDVYIYAQRPTKWRIKQTCWLFPISHQR